MSGILGPFGEHQEKENVKEFNSLIIGGQVQPHWRSLSCSSDSKSRELTISYRRSIARWLDMGWWSWIWMIFDWIICDIILAMWLHVNMMIIDDIHYIYMIFVLFCSTTVSQQSLQTKKLRSNKHPKAFIFAQGCPGIAVCTGVQHTPPHGGTMLGMLLVRGFPRRQESCRSPLVFLLC